MSANKIAALVITLVSTLVTTSNTAIAAGVHQSPAIEKLSEKSAVIEELETSKTMGGINPDYFAWVIKGRVELGFNRCDAAGRTAELKIKKIGEDLVVHAQIKKSPVEGTRVCSMQLDPVFIDVEQTVRGARSATGMILILNVDRHGSHEAFNP